MSRRGWWAVFLTVVLMAAIGGMLINRAIAYTGSFEIAEAASIRSTEVVETTDALTIALADSQRAMRGYLLTRDEDFLEPYTVAAPTVPLLLDRLRKLAADRSTMREDVALLSNRATFTVGFATRVVELGKAGKWDEAQALVRTGEGRRRMVATRELIESIKGGAKFERDTRRRLAGQMAEASIQSARLFVGLSAALVVLLVVAGWAGMRQAYRAKQA